MKASTSARVGAAVAVLLVLAGCGPSDEQSTVVDQGMVTDGRYCGLLSTDLAAEALGTDALRAEGKQLSQTGNANCTVDATSDGVHRLQITVNLKDDAGTLGTSAPKGCVELTHPDGWLGSWGCWEADQAEAGEGSFTSYAIPAKGHTLRVIQSTTKAEMDAAEKIAPQLLSDINDAVTAPDGSTP